jgi:hypothetical protein
VDKEAVRTLGAAVLALLLAGCNASIGDVGGGKLTITGCPSRIAVGEQFKLRAQWTAANAARNTLLRLEGGSNFRVNKVFDETMSRAQPNAVSGEYDLPGPRKAGSKKTIVVLISAKRAGDHNTIEMRVWGSGNVISAAPGDAASISCAVAISP